MRRLGRTAMILGELNRALAFMLFPVVNAMGLVNMRHRLRRSDRYPATLVLR